MTHLFPFPMFPSTKVSKSMSAWGMWFALLCLAMAGCGGEVPEAGPTTGGGTTGGASPAGDGELKRIIILNNGDSPFWDACRFGLQDAEKALKLKEAGYTAVMEVNDGTPAGQLDFLRQFASQSDIVAVGISATDANNVAIADEMRKLQEKGVKVITIDSDVDRNKMRDARFAFVGTDNLAGGRELGVCAKHLRSGGGQYVTFVGRTGAQNAIERIDGFAEGAGSDFESLDSMSDQIDRSLARENVRNAIQNHPGLNVLVGIWSYNAPAIADVVRDLNKRSEMTIVTFDAEKAAIDAMGEGLIDAMIVQNPYEMGYQGVRLMKALVEGDDAVIQEMLPNHGDTDGDIYDTGLKVVVPNAGSPLEPNHFSEKTEYYKLSDFQKWLDEYGLEGS